MRALVCFVAGAIVGGVAFLSGMYTGVYYTLRAAEESGVDIKRIHVKDRPSTRHPTTTTEPRGSSDPKSFRYNNTPVPDDLTTHTRSQRHAD